LDEGDFDVVVVGGGINGAVTAACLATRGARVVLVDRGDFAGFTSQSSSNLAWGGIKYLETYEFGLVRKLCVSRNHLIASYPSTVKEIRFFVTHEKTFRHARWFLFLGALFYWFIGSFFTRRPRILSVADVAREEPVVRTDGTDGGFEYSDAYLHDNDARFVWSFIRGALDHGCVALNYVESSTPEKTPGGWKIELRDVLSDRTRTIRCKALVNAAGPYVDEHNALSKTPTRHRHVFSKGIHLIVPRITKSRRVLTFFADDGRLFFVIPMGPRTCVGTTDTRVDTPEAFVTDDDRKFVLHNINARLKLEKPLETRDIISERCGVRPLVVDGGGAGKSDWMQLSRKHAVEHDVTRAHVSIFGGKLTDCLNVGEEVAALMPALGVTLPHPKQRWYGEPPRDVSRAFFHQAKLLNLDAMTAPTASEPISKRLWRRYGIDAFAMLDEIRADRGEADQLIVGAEYLRCEITYAARHEMVAKLDDFLRRRSKIAMVMADAELRHTAGLREACQIFFGQEADARFDEYFRVRDSLP
jgi:glycerol-3-phosphate dehydrogenase